jgi:hypothetical protein
MVNIDHEEYLTYGVRLEGGDWLDNSLKAHVENEGRCKEPVKRIHKERDENGREKAEYHLWFFKTQVLHSIFKESSRWYPRKDRN